MNCGRCGAPISWGDQWVGDGEEPILYCSLECLEADDGRAPPVVVVVEL